MIRDTIEIGEVPDLVRRASFNAADTAIDACCDAQDPSIQDAPALRVELADRFGVYRPGNPVHTINLSLLLLTEES